MKNICQPVSEVIIGAPYVLTDELLEQYNVSVRSRTYHRATFSTVPQSLFSIGTVSDSRATAKTQ